MASWQHQAVGRTKARCEKFANRNQILEGAVAILKVILVDVRPVVRVQLVLVQQRVQLLENRPQGPTRIRLGFWFTKSKHKMKSERREYEEQPSWDRNSGTRYVWYDE